MAHLGEKLKSYRTEKQWNQSEMADFIGVSFRSYQDIEKTGKVKKSDVLTTITQKTGIDVQNSAPPEKEKVVAPIESLAGAELIKAIITLTESNKGLVESNKTITDTNQVIADTNRVLAMKLLNEGATGSVHQDTETIFFATLGQLLDVLAEIGSGKRWHSKEEAVAVLGKKLFAQADVMKKTRGIQTDAGK